MSYYKQPARPILDLIRKETTNVGTLGGLHGNIAPIEQGRTGVAGAQWYMVQARGLSPSDILANVSTGDDVLSVPVVDGRADFANFAVDPTAGSVLLYTGVTPTAVQGDGNTTVPIRVSAPDATIVLYVNDAPVTRGYGSLSTDLILSPSLNVIQIVLERTILTNVVVVVPGWLPIGARPYVPNTPTWAEDNPAVYGFIGTSESSGAVTLRWADSRFVGVWNLERTSYRSVGLIQSTLYAEVEPGSIEGIFTITVNGDHSLLGGDVIVYPNTWFVAELIPALIGTVIDAEYDGTGVTTITILSETADQDLSGKVLYISDVRSIIGTVDRKSALLTSDGYCHYIDVGVKESVPYSYRLSAIHPVHASLVSAWSDSIILVAIDTTTPGNVTLNSATILGSEVVVHFTAPADIDYAGVRVYRNDGGTYTAILDHISTPGQFSELRYTPTTAGEYWLRTFDWTGNVQAEGDGVQVVYGGELQPKTTAIVREPNNTTATVTLTTTPATAIIRYMFYTEGNRPTALFPATWTTGSVGPVDFIINRDPVNTYIVEFYAILPGIATETSQTMSIDPDTSANATIQQLTESDANTLTIDINSTDSDVARYRIWSRPGSYPTTDGTITGALDNTYGRGTYERGHPGITHYASADTWYVAVVGYDFSGLAGPTDTDTIAIVGTPGGTEELGTLSNLNVVLASSAHRVDWSHNALVTADYRVRIFEKTPISNTYVEITTAPIEATSDTFTSPTPVASGSSFVTYHYRVYLFKDSTDAATLALAISIYNTSISGDYNVSGEL